MCYIKMNVASIISSCCSKCCRLEFSQGGPFSMQPIKYLFTSIRLVWHLFTPNIQAVSGVKKSSAHTLRRSPGFVSVIRGRKTYHCLQFRTIYYSATIISQWYLNISKLYFFFFHWKLGVKGRSDSLMMIRPFIKPSKHMIIRKNKETKKRTSWPFIENWEDEAQKKHDMFGLCQGS